MSDLLAGVLFVCLCALIWGAHLSSKLKITTCVHSKTLSKIVSESQNIDKALSIYPDKDLYVCVEKDMVRSEWLDLRSSLRQVYHLGK